MTEKRKKKGIIRKVTIDAEITDMQSDKKKKGQNFVFFKN